MHFGISFLILLTFFESLKSFLTNMVTTLMTSAKVAAPSLVKIKIFQNKGYDYDFTNKIYHKNPIIL